MKLVSVYETDVAANILYRLLDERPRENFISHEVMPKFEEHEEFVRSRPFRYWYLMRVHDMDGVQFVGALECTELNEIGIAVLEKFRGKGYGTAALKLFLATHKPLPAVRAVRNGHWLANIAPSNETGLRFFDRNGFKPIQETWGLT